LNFQSDAANHIDCLASFSSRSDRWISPANGDPASDAIPLATTRRPNEFVSFSRPSRSESTMDVKHTYAEIMKPKREAYITNSANEGKRGAASVSAPHASNEKLLMASADTYPRSANQPKNTLPTVLVTPMTGTRYRLSAGSTPLWARSFRNTNGI
uniref:Uncharacterized protein n=1 Tax=Haemonchus placei TaxID=6290 RepID=A0A158QQX7_HAEPC